MEDELRALAPATMSSHISITRADIVVAVSARRYAVATSATSSACPVAQIWPPR